MMKKNLTVLHFATLPRSDLLLTVGMYIGLTGVITFSLEVPNVNVNRVGSDQM